MKTRFQTILLAALALNTSAFSQQSQNDGSEHQRTAPIAPDENDGSRKHDGENMALRQALTLTESHAPEGAARSLEIAGGRAGEYAFLVFGREPSAIDLPFGGRLFVRPDLALAAGQFASDGMLQFALPQQGGGYAWPTAGGSDKLVLVQAVAIGGLEKNELTGRTSNVVDLKSDEDDGLARGAKMRFKLRETDTKPILELSMRSRARYRVEVERIAEDDPRGITSIYVRVYPIDGDVLPVPVDQKMRVELEAMPVGPVAVYAAEGDGSESEKIAPITDAEKDTAN